ncbi:hypothetical protein [Ralstonia mannitolilytica]|uniref:hypothetical protein n=1 Tax=Ralstonia mannitolilytica TaxID=105219 RepID=UPI000C79DC7F|nr:hypothetical protein [Ralstonia mannitolilytica]PLT18568.1 hypothetical protein CXP34_00735 [Ralstonia mannitolilytica]
MIKKKNNAYRLIKANTPKLALIHYATEFSPNRLASLFLKNISQDDLVIQKKSKDGFWDWKLADDTAYKYLKKDISAYLKKNADSPTFQIMLEHFNTNYLTKDYFGQDYQSLVNMYQFQEVPLKNFVREAFKATNPITAGMSPKEVAVRNQRLGKISVKHWIGDITNYDYFSQAPDFMMKNVQQALQYIDLYIMNLLNEKQLDQELSNLSVNQRLEKKLMPKANAAKTKPLKI